MRAVLSLMRSRAAMWLGACGLVVLQTACAQPLVVQPSVAVQGHLGGPVYGSIYAGPMYAPPPVVMAPPPVWVSPAPMVMAPRLMLPPQAYYAPRHHGHGYGHGHDGEHGWGRRSW